MRPDYQNMTTANLVDLLAQETQKFTQFMMDKKYGEEYETCKQVIQQIQAAISSRQELPEKNRDMTGHHFPDPVEHSSTRSDAG